MSTFFVATTLAALALVQGADPKPAEPAPATTVEAKPADQAAPAKDEQPQKEAAPAEQPEPEKATAKDDSAKSANKEHSESMKRPTEATETAGKRVGAFWFITIGK